MTDRDELVREAADAVDHMKVMSDVGRKYRLPDDSLDSLAEYADRYAAMAARIEADGKLIAEMRAAMREVVMMEDDLPELEGFDEMDTLRAILARLDAEAQR